MKFNFKICAYLLVLVGSASAFSDDSVDFFRAVNVDNARTVSALLARGFDANSLDEKGQGALYLALRSESPKVLAALLAHPGIHVDAANKANETPLMMAALRGDVLAAEQLLARGGQVNRAGWTPLHYAASGPEPRLVALLLDRGALIEAPSPNRTTPLMMAARYGTQDSALVLLQRGADPRIKNDAGLHAADFARQAGREPLALQLERAAR